MHINNDHFQRSISMRTHIIWCVTTLGQNCFMWVFKMLQKNEVGLSNQTSMNKNWCDSMVPQIFLMWNNGPKIQFLDINSCGMVDQKAPVIKWIQNLMWNNGPNGSIKVDECHKNSCVSMDPFWPKCGLMDQQSETFWWIFPFASSCGLVAPEN